MDVGKSVCYSTCVHVSIAKDLIYKKSVCVRWYISLNKLPYLFYQSYAIKDYFPWLITFVDCNVKQFLLLFLWSYDIIEQPSVLRYSKVTSIGALNFLGYCRRRWLITRKIATDVNINYLLLCCWIHFHEYLNQLHLVIFCYDAKEVKLLANYGNYIMISHM